jgi:hypothetical protein
MTMLYLLHLVSDFLPIIVFLIFLQRNRQKQLWVIFIYSCCSAATDVITRYGHLGETRDFYLYSIFSILEYSFFLIFFNYNFQSPLFKKILFAGTVIFFLVAAYNLFFDSTHRFDTLSASVDSILIICYSIFYFYEQLKTPEPTFIYSTKTFWVVIAILLYMAGTFIFFIATAYMTAKETYTYWPIASIANILKNLLLSVAFILKIQSKDKYIQSTYNF